MDLRMQSLNAVSLTQSVNAWFENSLHPRILHVFDDACNLFNEKGDVLSVVTSQVGNGPFNLVIDEEILFSQCVHADSAVSASGNQLTLGPLTIDKRNAPIWNPRSDWEKLHLRMDAIVSCLPDLGFELNVPALQVPSRKSLVSRLCSAIANSDLWSSVHVATKLAGLGPGLTPSGDDVILGAVYAAWIIHPADVAKSLAEAVAKTAAPRTTSLSAAWLRSAGRGEAGIFWHQFFDELCTAPISEPGTLIRLRDAVDRILNVGETSGADAFSSFMETFASYGQKART